MFDTELVFELEKDCNPIEAMNFLYTFDLDLRYHYILDFLNGGIRLWRCRPEIKPRQRFTIVPTLSGQIVMGGWEFIGTARTLSFCIEVDLFPELTKHPKFRFVLPASNQLDPAKKVRASAYEKFLSKCNTLIEYQKVLRGMTYEEKVILVTGMQRCQNQTSKTFCSFFERFMMREPTTRPLEYLEEFFKSIEMLRSSSKEVQLLEKAFFKDSYQVVKGNFGKILIHTVCLPEKENQVGLVALQFKDQLSPLRFNCPLIRSEEREAAGRFLSRFFGPDVIDLRVAVLASKLTDKQF